MSDPADTAPLKRGSAAETQDVRALSPAKDAGALEAVGREDGRRFEARAPTLSARYQDLGVLASGGMGEVRLLRDATIGREVAAKFLRADREKDEALERFVWEACLQGRLEHPSIVPVHDVGSTPEGLPYFTMKQVRGVTLARVLERLAHGDAEATERFTRRKLLSAFGNVCLAVAFAHERGVVHRDLKPANIMLGDFGETYVLDWGISSSIDADTSTLRRRGGSAPEGSPGYMAPEQIMGTDDARRPAVDIYALGAILFEILALQPLHRADDASDRIASTLEGADARPSRRAPEAEIPPELDAICVRATEMHPDVRYKTARELSEAVERFLDGKRDLELRRHLASSDIAAAETLLAREGEVGPEGVSNMRSEAMNLLGRALALEPTQTRAVERMMDLLLNPPPVMPVEAALEFGETSARQFESFTRLNAFAFLGSAFSLGVIFSLGLTDVTTTALIFAGISVGFGANLIGLRNYRHFRAAYTTSLIGMLFAAALTSRIFAPFVLAPMLIAMVTMCYLLTPAPSMGNRTLALGAFALFSPWAVEWLGLVAPTFSLENGAILLFGSRGVFPSGWTEIVLLGASNFVALFVPWVYVSRVRAPALAARERQHLQLWLIRQLLPKAARASREQGSTRPQGISESLRKYVHDPQFLDRVQGIVEKGATP